MNQQKVLLVDDEPNVLAGYQRNIRRQFNVESTTDPREGLNLLQHNGPFAVVCSDMRMPEMDGVQFLQAAKRISPDTVRIMLTGNLDQPTATNAVNSGSVYRFLNKPCTSEMLSQAIADGILQYKLAKSEKELLSKTLSASVGLLTEVLTLVNPLAFGRAARTKTLVSKLCNEMGFANSWEIPIAAMLSQVGCVAIPERTLAKIHNGQTLSQQEEQAIAGHPTIGKQLIGKIPRLEVVAEIVGRQTEEYDPLRDAAEKSEQILVGADILKVVLDFDEYISSGAKPELAIRCMVDRAGVYNPSVLNALMAMHSISFASTSVEISQLKDGMILEEHIMSELGDLLVTQGQEVNSGMRERLRTYSSTSGRINGPVRVLCPWLQTTAASATAAS
jgi:response regulator RpfG family c-di-GMP phosphodiesterase